MKIIKTFTAWRINLQRIYRKDLKKLTNYNKKMLKILKGGKK